MKLNNFVLIISGFYNNLSLLNYVHSSYFNHYLPGHLHETNKIDDQVLFETYIYHNIFLWNNNKK